MNHRSPYLCRGNGLKRLALSALCALGIILIASPSLSLAQNSTWNWPNYNSATNWTGVANWIGGVPTGSNTAVFTNFGDQIITVSGNQSTGGILFTSPGSFANDYYFNGGNFILSPGAVIQTGSGYQGIAGISSGITQNGNATISADGAAGSAMYFSNTLTTNASLGNVTLTLGGSNAGYHTYVNNVMGGIITQGSGTTLKLVKSGTGSWVILGGNSYTGGTDLNGGTVITGSSNAFGTVGTISVLSNTTLRTASALNDVSSRLFISDGATFVFDSGGQNSLWQGAIGNSGGSNSAALTKTGVGVLTLRSGNSTQTYRGATTINSGTLSIDGLNAGNLTASVMVNPISSDSALVLGGGVLNIRAGTSSVGNVTATIPGSSVLTIATANTNILVGALVTGANITAGTTVTAVSGSNVTLSSNLTGGASGNYSFGATSLNQTFNGTTLTPGVSQFLMNSGSGNHIINLGSITRPSGALLNFVNVSGYTIQTSTTNDSTGAIKGVLWNLSGDFARVVGGNLTGVSYTTQNNASLWTSATALYNTNAAVTGVVGTGGVTDIGGLKLSFAGSNSFTINGTLRTSNGIIFGGTIAANPSQISGGSLTSTSGDLIISSANNQNIFGRNTISSTIVDNGSPTDVILNSGLGTLFIAGNNTYTGNTTIGAGQNNGIGTVVIGGASGASIGSAGKTVLLNGGSGGASAILRIGNADATGDIKGTLNLANGRLSLNRTDTFTLSATVIGTTGAGSISLDNVGNATVNLGAGENIFASLGTTAAGTLNLAGNGTYTFLSAPVTFAAGSTTSFNSGNYYFGSPGNSANNTIGTWLINGGNVTIGAGRYFNSAGGNLTLNSGSFKSNGTAVGGPNGNALTLPVVYNVTGGTFTTAMASNAPVAASLAVGSANVTATGSSVFNQSGGVVNVSVPNNANLLSLNGIGLMIGVGGSLHESTYNLSGGTLRNFGGISVASAAAPGVGGSNNFNWTGGTLTTAGYNGTFLLSNSSNNTLVQNGVTTVMAPGDTYEGTLYSGRTAIVGGYQINSGTVAIGIGGNVSAASFHETSVNRYDQITVTGATTLGGRLALALNNSYTPPSDVITKFDILTGSASGITGSFTNGMVATGGNTRVVLANGLSSMLVAVNNTGSTATVGGLTNVGAYRVAVGGYQAANTYNATSGSSWDAADAASWTNFDAGSSSSASGAIAQFADGAATSAGANAVDLSSVRNIRGLDFSSTGPGKTYTISGTGSLIMDNTLNNAAATITDASASGTVNAINVPIALNSNLAVDVAGSSNALEIGGAISGGQGITKAGLGNLALLGTNTYTNTTTVAAGGLLVSGSTAAASAVTVASDARIGGNGNVNGNLTLNSGAKFIFDLDNTPLTVGGTFALDSSFGIASLVNSDGSALDWSTVAADTYTLISTSFVFNAGNIQNFGAANAVDIGGGRTAFFQNGSLQLVVIPEPSTYAMAVLGLLGLMAFIRNRRRKAA